MADARVSGSRARVLTSAPAGEGRAGGLRVRTLVQLPAEEAQIGSARIRSLWGGGGGLEGQASQITARILIRYALDSRQLRAWTFTQDDHDFYVLQLGGEGTLVYDKLTGQWAKWKSPSYGYWRGNDGVQWEGWNICCDTESGILWKIDADGRLDEEVTPITSVVTGGISTRMRKHIPNYMAEVALSEGRPPAGFEDGTVGITLRTSDDGGQTWTSHGEIVGGGTEEDVCIRWYGLGLISPIGRVFEITDTGYARRIDGLNAEIADG
jgi:hypothetical protein